MNDIFNEVGKKMPYKEDEAYLNQLIEQATDQALQHKRKHRSLRHRVMMITSAAAVVLLVVGIGLTFIDRDGKASVTTQQVESPIDEFLHSLSDEEVAQLPYYEIEEIPEY